MTHLIDTFTHHHNGFRKDSYVMTSDASVWTVHSIYRWDSGCYLKTEPQEFTGPDGLIMARIHAERECTLP